MSHVPDIATLLPILKDLYHSRLLNGCALTLVVYDWLLVFPDEYETILQSRWSLAKFLYYFIRVMTPMGLFLGTWREDFLAQWRHNLSNGPTPELSDVHGPLSDQFCVVWGFVSSFALFFGMCAGNALLALRLTALYRQQRWVVWFIRGFFFASYAVTLGLALDGLATFHDNLHYSHIVRSCATVKLSKTFPAVFYSPAAFEFFIFTLTLWRGWQDAQIFAGVASAPLLVVLYRDGFICFFVMLGVRIWNIWIYATQPVSSYNLGTHMLWSINAVLTTRVYMNLVWIVRGPLIEGTGMGTTAATGAAIPMRAPKSTVFQTQDWKSSGILAMNVDDGETRSQTTREVGTTYAV